MNLCLSIIADNQLKVNASYDKISEKFCANNNLIHTENVPDIMALRDRICSTGSKYEKIVVVVLTAEFNYEAVADAIADIAGALGVTQSITICDYDDLMSAYLAHAMVEYSDTLIYTNLEKRTPTQIYNAVFGVKQKSVSSETESALNNIKKAKKKELESNAGPTPIPVDDGPIPILIDDEPMPIPVEDEPSNKKKKFGFKDLFKRKSKSEPEPIPIPVEDESEPEPIPIPVEDEEPKPIASVRPKKKQIKPEPEPEDDYAEPVYIAEKYQPKREILNTYAEDEDDVVVEDVISTPSNNAVPEPDDYDEVSEPEEDDFVPVLDDDMFITSEPVYEEEEEAMPESIMKAPQRVKKSAPKPEVDEIEEEVTPSKKKKFGKKNKSTAPKIDKSALSMQTRPRIVYVTGTGRIGQSTLAASLGFTAAQYYCKSLIVDMDMIRRAISCIYQDYANTSSAHAMGLVSAIRSPHLIDEIANEHYDNVSTLGVSIDSEDNREIMQSVTPDAVQSLLLQALTRYNFVVVDMPWEYLIANPVLMTVPHDILFVTSNDIMTMISDLNQLTPDSFDKPDTFNMLISKMRFVLNMTSPNNVFERKTITEKNFNKVCYTLTEEEMFTTIPVIANIPMVEGVGNQATYGKPASAYLEEFSAHCAAILHELK